jgi:DNA polymerase
MDINALITLDFETYYSTKNKYSLRHLTTEAYVRDPRFQVIGVGVSTGLEAPTWMNSPAFQKWSAQVDWSKVRCLAHHAHFDGLILSHHYGVRPGFWVDTLSMAREIHGVEVSGSLAKLAEYYKAGRKGDAAVAADGKWLVDFTPAEWAAYGEYCCNDVALTREIFLAMYPDMSIASIRGIDMMVRMFTEPSLLVNAPFLGEYRDWDRSEKQRLLETVLALDMRFDHTDEQIRDAVMSGDKFAAALIRLGVDPPTKVSAAKTKSAGKPVETWALAKTDPGFQALLEYGGENAEVVQALARARLAVRSTINETRADRLLAAGKQGRPVPVYLKWYAAHTGRAGGGDKMNFQNLERVDPTGKDPRKGSLRKSLIAPPGHKLVVVDSSQIEARVLAWVAGAQDLLQLFRQSDETGLDFYAARGADFFGYPLSKEKTPHERQIAKALVLGLGFGMGWKKCATELLKGMLGTDPVVFVGDDAKKYGVDLERFADKFAGEARGAKTRLSPDDFEIHAAVAERFVEQYRRTSPRIVRLWKDLQAAIPDMCHPDAESRGIGFGPLVLGYHRARMPDGSYIRYPDLRETGRDDYDRPIYTYMGRGKSRLKLYGGLLTENVVQGIARCVVFDQALRIQSRIRDWGGHVVMTVHDEVVSMVPGEHARAALAASLQEMRTLPSWCEGLPIAATGGIGQDYGSAK